MKCIMNMPNRWISTLKDFLGDGLRYEIKDFISMINGNDKSGVKLTRGESIAMAEIMEKFLSRENRNRL